MSGPVRRATEPLSWKVAQLRVIGASAVAATKRALRPLLGETVPSIIELVGTCEAMRTVVLPAATTTVQPVVASSELDSPGRPYEPGFVERTSSRV